MVISDPNEERISFSAYGDSELFVEWRKPTKEEIEKVRARCSKDFADKMLSRLWRKRPPEEIEAIKKLPPLIARDILNHFEYKMTDEEKKENEKIPKIDIKEWIAKHKNEIF